MSYGVDNGGISGVDNVSRSEQMLELNRIYNMNNLDGLKLLEDNSIDSIVTDPPYELGFMGKSWDKTLPDIGIFKECFRVLKAGSFAFVMSAPRSDVCARMMLLLEDAGFEICFTPIYWSFASGFPKALNITRKINKDAESEKALVCEMWRSVFNSSERVEAHNDWWPLPTMLENLEQGEQYSVYAYPGSQGTSATVSKGRGKPLKLMSYLITLGSRPGDVVLDPFLGSGTTAIAAKQLGRECIGIEREEEYVEIAKARLSTPQPSIKI